MTPGFTYFDTSLLIPLYIKTAVTPLAERAVAEFTKNGELPMVLSGLTRLEFVSAIAKCVRTRQIDKQLAAAAALFNIEHHFIAYD